MRFPRDLLLGESYFLLMVIRLLETPPVAAGATAGLPLEHSGGAGGKAERGGAEWALEERERLRFVNRFVLSLYEDLGALLQANATTQLKKIKLLCMQAMNDMSKLNEYVRTRTALCAL